MSKLNGKDWYHDVYLNSWQWKARRHAHLQSASFMCENRPNNWERCGVWATQVHHLSYENKWREKPEDLMALCRFCHEWLHRPIEAANDNERQLSLPLAG